jgi:tetratricopeptide (TPR) repeat protein
MLGGGLESNTRAHLTNTNEMQRSGGQAMRRALLGLSAAIWLSAACGGDKPEVGPVPSWVEPVALPADDGSASDAAVKFLLTDWQVNFSGGESEAFFHSVIRVQTPQGLSSIGTIPLPWNPATDTLTMHHLQIVRAGQSIDALGPNPLFTVVRRENSLEFATLNGQLTLVLQPPGLQVGDLLDLAFTLRRADPILGDNPEMVVSDWPRLPIDHLSFRGRWTAPTAMRWWASDVMPKLQETRRGDVTAVRFDLDHPPTLTLPANAPTRFRIGRVLQFSSYKSWQKISAQLAPLYRQAARLAPQSPLQAELTRIRAASSDPAQQALGALALVQDQVRYVYLGMNEGAIVPADAELTWQRRFGDCKGKTALLLALLHELQITAEPVAVNVVAGDSVKGGLPLLEAFNHVLVRASIGRKFYWLDGARSGDRKLTDLAPPPYYWGLPLVPEGSDLVQIVTEAPSLPQNETFYAIDASGGIPGPAKLHGLIVFRGAMAAGLRYTLGNLSSDDRDKVLRKTWEKAFGSAKVDAVTAKFDEQLAEEHLTVDGSLPLDWSGEHLQLEGLELTFNVPLTRDAGAHGDVPFALPFPNYSHCVETIKLPSSAVPFTTEGGDINRTVGGVEFRRQLQLRDGVLTAEESIRTVMTEISAKEAAAASEAVKDITGSVVYLHAPPGYVAMQRQDEVPAPPPLLAAAPEQTADELLRHGNELLDKRQYHEALQEFERAVKLEPHSPWALADRGLGHIGEGDYALARQDLDAAAAIEPANPVVARGRGVLALRANNTEEAIREFSATLKQEPGNPMALDLRAEAYRRRGEIDKALDDNAELIRVRPHFLRAYKSREALLRKQGRIEEALQQADAVVAANADQTGAYLAAADIYEACGKREQALAAVERSLSMSPTSAAYLMRVGLRPRADLAGREQDLRAAAQLAPSSDVIIQLADTQRDAGNYAEASNTLEQGIAALGKTPDLLIHRGIVYAKQAQLPRAEADFKAVRDKYTDAHIMNNMCWAIATADVSLDAALGACEVAIAQRPDVPAYLDSRGFVLLRLGRLKESIAAYDAALKLQGDFSSSLYCRGIAKRRLGDTAGGDADIQAALLLNPKVADHFADFGVKP